MNLSKIAVLTTLAAIIKKYKGNWGTASQQRLLELLATYHHIDIKRRQLGYHLADLRTEKLITTIKRHNRDENGQVCLLSSATALTMKGCLTLYRLGNLWALKHLRYLKQRYLPAPLDISISEKMHKSAAPRRSSRKLNPFLDPGFRADLGLPAPPPFKA